MHTTHRVLSVAIILARMICSLCVTTCIFTYSGLRFIPLRTPGGESASHIGIFVKIKMNKLSHKQASSSGICSLQDVNSPMKRFTSPKLLETYQLTNSLDGDTTVIVEEHESHSREEKTVVTDICSLSNGTADDNSNRTLHNQPKIVRQKAVIECTAEVHVNPSTA